MTDNQKAKTHSRKEVNTMCDYEDMDVISRYTKQQAVEDGVFVEILRFHGRPVLATAHIAAELGVAELRAIWNEFRHWDAAVKPALPEEEQMFSTGANGKKVWVIEDGESFTIMYPEDY
jgi:hypothetical protein